MAGRSGIVVGQYAVVADGVQHCPDRDLRGCHAVCSCGAYHLQVGLLLACISVMTTTRNLVKNAGSNVMLCFKIYFSIVMFLWFGYPISFSLSEGGNVMQPDSEGIFYGILGVLLLGIPPALFVPVAYNIGFEKLGLNDTVDHYGQGAAPTGSAVSKPPAPLPSAKGTDSADKGDAAKQSSKKTKRVKKVKRPIREPPNEPAEEEISESAGGY